VVLEVQAEDSFIDVLAAGFDAGIRYDERLERDMIRVPIGPREQRFVLAGAPGLIAARGRPGHPHDLLDFPCIRHRFASGIMAAWEFERGDEIVRVAPGGPLVASSLEMESAAATAGLGLIYTFEDQIRGALADGRLIPLLEDWTPPFSGPYLYYPSRRHTPAPLRAFIDFIRADASAPS
jgi:DNA-binding transcriptional LysR family regulator